MGWGVLVSIILVLLSQFPVYAQETDVGCAFKPPFERGLMDMTIESGGRERGFLLYIPTGYDGATPLPLVLSIHGLASNRRQQREFSRWDELAERDTVIVVYPQGTGFPLRWNSGVGFAEMNGEAADDVAFLSDLLDHLEATYCIDPARVYATGLSNGGGMSNRLACEMADRITAIGTVAGAYSALPGGCNPSRAVPVISFHGVVDPIVPYDGSDDLNLPAIEDWAADWADRNSCTDAMSSTSSEANALIVTEYGGCTDGVEVALYTIPDGGHTWPGAPDLPVFLVGITRHDFDATAIMWDFLRRFAISS